MAKQGRAKGAFPTAGPSALTLVRGCDEILSLGRQCAEIFVQDRRHIERFALEAERVQRPGQMTG
jgi:hypothetical protein